MRYFYVILTLSSLMFSNVSFSANSSSCDNYSNGICTYSANVAKNYARNYALTDTAFPQYQYYGGNCTNFVSQAVLAGLVGSSDKYQVYNKRTSYMADYYKGCDYCWYYNVPSISGYAWKGAHEMYVYAGSNQNAYWGMHFDFITEDSPTQSLETYKVKVGDVIFADWDGDDDIDHTMIVTKKTSNSYSGIKVSYQNSTGYLPRKDISLSQINGTYVVFHVYRPTFYKN